MTEKSPNIDEKIKVLEVEVSSIESKATHQGFWDASRRNRIEEQLEVLDEAARRGGAPSAKDQDYIEEQHSTENRPGTAAKDRPR